MVEAGVSQADKTEFTECWKTSWRTPYIMRLALSAGIGGLLFGYDTVSMAVAGAIFGAAIGGWMNDRFGRKISIMVADLLFFAGAIIMAAAPAPWMIILGLEAHLSAQRFSYHRRPVPLISHQSSIHSCHWDMAVDARRCWSSCSHSVYFDALSPESPRWLFRNGKEEDAKSILEKIYRPEEVEDELQSLRQSIEQEKQEQAADGGFLGQLKHAWKNDVVRGLYAGITVQVAQQFVAPKISAKETAFFGGNSTCQAYMKADDAAAWGCMRCLGKQASCAYCSAAGDVYQPGACLEVNDAVKGACRAAKRTWYTEGCPSKIGFVAVIFLGLYIIIYSPGMGTVPWIVNSEIYPLKYRGIGGGIAAVSNWTANLVVSETFLTLTEHLGSSGTFLLFAGFSLIGLVSIFLLVPETKGLQFGEVEKLLEKGYSPFKKCSKKVKEGHNS
ncbi:UNVERIFIED_CONTAM: Inositol transporter 4 [Sesamum angustifolium]|uniref:Inositol transporter 4 n=1 Tax=Sesamum angustifolium TaxID=2727405 RepID=A0AAW2KMG1_9LAMI